MMCCKTEVKLLTYIGLLVVRQVFIVLVLDIRDRTLIGTEKEAFTNERILYVYETSKSASRDQLSDNIYMCARARVCVCEKAFCFMHANVNMYMH